MVQESRLHRQNWLYVFLLWICWQLEYNDKFSQRNKNVWKIKTFIIQLCFETLSDAWKYHPWFRPQQNSLWHLLKHLRWSLQRWDDELEGPVIPPLCHLFLSHHKFYLRAQKIRIGGGNFRIWVWDSQQKVSFASKTDLLGWVWVLQEAAWAPCGRNGQLLTVQNDLSRSVELQSLQQVQELLHRRQSHSPPPHELSCYADTRLLHALDFP